jgi:hypothetical protein
MKNMFYIPKQDRWDTEIFKNMLNLLQMCTLLVDADVTFVVIEIQ